jgi:hypothetical protein
MAITKWSIDEGRDMAKVERSPIINRCSLAVAAKLSAPDPPMRGEGRYFPVASMRGARRAIDSLPEKLEGSGCPPRCLRHPAASTIGAVPNYDILFVRLEQSGEVAPTRCGHAFFGTARTPFATDEIVDRPPAEEAGLNAERGVGVEHLVSRPIGNDAPSNLPRA